MLNFNVFFRCLFAGLLIVYIGFAQAANLDTQQNKNHKELLKVNNAPSIDSKTEKNNINVTSKEEFADKNKKLESSSSNYEAIINEYTKYLSGVSKAVKDEESAYFDQLVLINKDIAKLKNKKVALYMKLSPAAKIHQEQKSAFEKKLYQISKNRFYELPQQNFQNKK